MSFGLVVSNASGSVQANASESIYECIYSSTAYGARRFSGVVRGDIFAFTYISGSLHRFSGGVGAYLNPNNLIFFGTHRVLVFRSRAIMNRRGENFGLQVMDSSGRITYSSDGFPLLIRSGSQSYAALVWQGGSSRLGRRSNNNETEYIVNAAWVNRGGTLGSASHNLGHWWDQTIAPATNMSTPSLVLDVSAIPLNYSLGYIGQGAGTDYQHTGNPLN